MKYLVIEIQCNEEGAISNIVTVHNTKEEAESKYFTVLSFAALSDLPRHSAAILTEEGLLHMSRSYSHIQSVNEEEQETTL